MGVQFIDIELLDISSSYPVVLGFLPKVIPSFRLCDSLALLWVNNSIGIHVFLRGTLIGISQGAFGTN
jgi:hypothetical protein